MAILGLLFPQKRTIIGVKDDSASLATMSGFLPQTVAGIGGIVVDATLSEQHTSTCEVTDNPVEDGEKVADHVQINPAQLIVEGVISDTPIGLAFIGNPSLSGGISGASSLSDSSLSIQAYNKLLDLQRSRQPFTVITGLRRYQNMILAELDVPRNVQTGNVIHFRATMREVRIVKSQAADASLASDIKDLGAKKKDKGQKITDPINKGSKISSESTSTNKPSTLKGFFGPAVKK